MTQTQKDLVRMMASAIINAYDDNGNLVDEYYNNIVLQDLTERDLVVLKKMARGLL